MPRQIVLSFLLGLALLAGSRTAIAGDASSSTLASLGLPGLTIRVTDGRIEAPAHIPAGRTLVSVVNAGAGETQVLMGQLPPGKTGADWLAAENAAAPPDWLLQMLYVGIPSSLPAGGRGETVVDLAPGKYTLLGSGATAEMTVTPAGGSPVPPVAIPADVTLRLFEFGFQAPATLTAGSHVFAVVNAGRVPHELRIARAPAPLTTGEAQTLFASDDDAATPGGDGPSMGEFTPVAGISWMAAGATAWLEIDLEAGTYLLSCWVDDPATHLRHAMEGMVAVLTVT